MRVSSTPLHPPAGDIAPERLAGNSALTEKEKLAEASRQFEAILTRQILEAGQKPVIASKYTDTSATGGVYRDMITTQLAESISKTGALGLARVFEAQLSAQIKTLDAPESDGADRPAR